MRSEERGVPTHRADMSSLPPPHQPLKDGNLHTADRSAPLCPPFHTKHTSLNTHVQTWPALQSKQPQTHKCIFGTDICLCLMHELGFMTGDAGAAIALYKHARMHRLLHM